MSLVNKKALANAKLSRAQKAVINMTSAIVKNITHNNFAFYKSEVINGKRVLQEDIGTLKAGNRAPNGVYVGKDGTAYIDINAGNYGQGTILWTVAHELTHFIKDNSTQSFKRPYKIVENANGKDKMQELVNNQIKKAKRNGRTIDEETAKEEVIADSMQTMLTTHNIFDTINAKSDNKLLNLIKSYLDRIHNLIAGFHEKYGKESDESKALKKNTEAFENAYDEFVKGLYAGGQNFAQQKNTADDGVRYEIRDIVGESGNNYGLGVYLNSDLLTNLTDEERVKMVKEYIKELGGSTFTAYDDNGKPVDVYIAKPNQKFKNKNGKRVPVNQDLTSYLKNEVKQEAIALIDELIITASSPQSKSSNYSHGWLDNYGKNNWEYWTTYIEDKNHNIWEAKLNIANTVNGEKILYDIFPIKKVGRSVTSDTIPTNNSILQNSEKSQDISKNNEKNEDIRFDDRNWHTGLTKNEVLRIIQIAKNEVNRSENHLNYNTKMLYTDKNGRPYFALYSTEHTDDPTILYACKGKKAEQEYQFVNEYLSLKEYKNENIKSSTGMVDKIHVFYKHAYSKGYVNSVNALGRGSGNGNVKIYNRLSTYRPSRALQNCLRNIAENEERSDRLESPDNDNYNLSDRDNNALDNRSLLSNALETVAQNDIEKKYISQYKENINKLNEYQNKLSDLRSQIKELSFSSGGNKELRAVFKREIEDKLTRAKFENTVMIKIMLDRVMELTKKYNIKADSKEARLAQNYLEGFKQIKSLKAYHKNQIL